MHIHQEWVNTTVLCTWIKHHLDLHTSTPRNTAIQWLMHVFMHFSAYNSPSDPVFLCTWDVWVPRAATNCHHHSSSCDDFLLSPAVHMLAEKRSECKPHCRGCGKGTCCGNDLVSRCFLSKSYSKLQARYYTVVTFLWVDPTFAGRYDEKCGQERVQEYLHNGGKHILLFQSFP